MDSKSKYEIAIFKKFISVYPYKINEGTIQKLEVENKPDIYCKLSNGDKCYFELTECVCESIAQQTGESLKALRTNKGSNKGHNAVAFKEDLLFNKSMEKFGKNYQTDGSVELLSYFNQQAEPLGDIYQYTIILLRSVLRSLRLGACGYTIYSIIKYYILSQRYAIVSKKSVVI